MKRKIISLILGIALLITGLCLALNAGSDLDRIDAALEGNSRDLATLARRPREELFSFDRRTGEVERTGITRPRSSDFLAHQQASLDQSELEAQRMEAEALRTAGYALVTFGLVLPIFPFLPQLNRRRRHAAQPATPGAGPTAPTATDSSPLVEAGMVPDLH